jgi:uncharacterized membrane protein
MHVIIFVSGIGECIFLVSFIIIILVLFLLLIRINLFLSFETAYYKYSCFVFENKEGFAE